MTIHTCAGATPTRAAWAVPLALLLAATPAPADDLFAGHDTLDRAALIEAVLERNQTVAAARQGWQALGAMPSQAGALDDPMIGYAFAPRSIGASDVRYGQIIDFSQSIPFFGKRSLRAAAARAEAEAAREDLEAVRREIALMASMLFDDYYTIERSLEINAEHDTLLEELMASARAKYVAGETAQHVLLTIEIELAHVDHDDVILGSEREIIRARLNALLHRPPDASLPAPGPKVAILPGAEATYDSRASLESRPEVAAARARVLAAERSASLARREYLPDLTVGVEYNDMWDMPEHRLMTGIAINVPLQLGRRKAAVDEAEARLLQRKSEEAVVVDQLLAEITTAQERAREAHHVLELYRQRLVPAARDRVASVRAGFEVGRSELETLIETDRKLRDIELAGEIALADLNRRTAELDRAVGRMPGLDSYEVPK